MHVSRLAGALAVCLLSGGIAHAQPAVGYQLNRYEPTPAGDPFSIVEYPWYASTRFLAAGLTFDYARNLLVSDVGPAPIANSQGLHLDVADSELAL